VNRYRDQVASALRSVSIRGTTRHVWFGRVSRPLPAALHEEMDVAQRRAHLVACLGQELYSSFYCPGRPVPRRRGEPGPVAADWALAEAMSTANSGRGSWEPGWMVQRIEGDEAVVSLLGLRARVALAECRPDAGAIRVGAAVSLRRPKELPALSPGFYTAVSETWMNPALAAAMVRVYWNIGRFGAPALMRELTSRLNAEHVPYRLKVADHAHRFDRCDAAVLYVPADVFGTLRAMLREVSSVLATSLRPRTPAFTLELAPGVGLAEDDTPGRSFGVGRCSLLADAIVLAHERGATRMAARLDVVTERFAAAGVSIDAPYRAPSLAGRHVL
jgi:hypothetical protein